MKSKSMAENRVYNTLYDGNSYPVRELHIREFGDIIVSTTQLEQELLDYSTFSYISDKARCIDEQISYYVSPDEICLAESDLVQLVENGLEL